MQGKITEINKDIFIVDSNDTKYNCKCRGLLRKRHIEPVVGDICLFNPSKLIIEDILERRNIFDRPKVSNIDIAFIITSLKEPNFSTDLLDKFLVTMEVNNVTPIICTTKEDLLNVNERKVIMPILEYYKNIGYTVISNNDIDKIKNIIKKNTIVFTGQTGAGKSTLLNKLNNNLKLKTGKISKALGRGKHTTRLVTLYKIDNGYILDTPGFSNIDLSKYSKEQIKESFIEFNNYPCIYKDCTHTKEEECKIKEAVRNNNILQERYEDYLKFIGGNK